MMEVLGAPQTHLGLKAMIQEVDEDGDGRISFREVGCLFLQKSQDFIRRVTYDFIRDAFNLLRSVTSRKNVAFHRRQNDL